MRQSIIMGKLLHEFHTASFDRYEVLHSCAIRPDERSELITHVCVFQTGVDQYPNADQAYLAIDIYDYHDSWLRSARMEKLLLAGLAEYWALDIVEGNLTVYQPTAGVIKVVYDLEGHISPSSFPDVQIDLSELSEWVIDREPG